MWSSGGGSARPEGIVGAGIVVAIYINRLLRRDGEAVSLGRWVSRGWWQEANAASTHAGVDEAHHVAWAGDHVPLRRGCAAGDPGGRPADVIGLAHRPCRNAKTGTQVGLTPVVEETVLFFGHIFRRIGVVRRRFQLAVGHASVRGAIDGVVQTGHSRDAVVEGGQGVRIAEHPAVVRKVEDVAILVDALLVRDAHRGAAAAGVRPYSL